MDREDKYKEHLLPEVSQLKDKLTELVYQMNSESLVSIQLSRVNKDDLEWYKNAEGAALLVFDGNSLYFYHQLLDTLP